MTKKVKNELNGESVSTKSINKKDKMQNDRESKKLQLEERQRLKMEEKIKKEQEKKCREEERKRKDLEKEIERKKKELEKEEEKKKKENERKQKEIEKDEERRKKEEERKLKEFEREEEKRRKEEERKKKEDDRRREEEEKNKKLEKQRGFFLGYFNKDKNDQEFHDTNICGFKPIATKKDMKMSCVERIKKNKINSISDLINSSKNYLDELIEGQSGNGCCDRTWHLPHPEIEVLSSRRLKAKTFLFVENIRPPYFGTWRKSSSVITPLNPLAEDTKFFDYDLDSDQEWEYESGEDIASSDNEEDEDIDEEPEDVSFVVPHGYLSDGEDIIDADPDEVSIHTVKKSRMSIENMKAQIIVNDKQFQAECKQQVHQINPSIIRPLFVSNQKNQPVNELFRMICRTGEGFPINCNLQSDFDCSTNVSKIKSVPPEAVAHLIRLVHCNNLSRAKLCYEFRMFWEYSLTKRLPDVTFENDLQGKDWDEFSIGKRRFFDKLKEIADRKDGMWIVKSDVIQEYQLCCLNDDPEKPCMEKWKYVSDVLNTETKKNPKAKKRKGTTTDTSATVEKSIRLDNDTKPLE